MKKVLADVRLPVKCKRKLTELGFRIIDILPSDRLSPPVASHPDMIFFQYGEQLVCHRSYAELYPDIISEIDCELLISDQAWSELYPHDVIFNAIHIGNYIFCRRKSVSEEIARLPCEIIDVNQGYTACSVCRVSDKAIITADSPIARVSEGLGFDVLKIAPGSIDLTGLDYGFIGGCCGDCGDSVYFTGNILSHPDGEKIIDFCSRHGKSAVSLSDDSLFDVGKLIFI